jgi:hypothetical protein
MSRRLGCVLTTVVLSLILLPVLQAVNPTFIPDSTFKGSTLTGWHVLGEAGWKAQNGEVVGTAKPGGGWLVLDKSYQDVAIFASFKCTGGCKAGVLLRAEKTPDGMKGVYVSLTDGDVANYSVVLDAQGKEVKREKLRYAGSWVRIMPPVDPNAPARAMPAGGRPGGRGPTVPLPLTAPSTAMRPDDWNDMEIILDAGVIRTYLNGGREVGGAAEDNSGRYGPVALFVGGTGEVSFKNIAYKDLAFRVTPIEKVAPRFRVQQISDMYYSWSSAAGDFNRDGVLDIVSGPYIYYGPDFTKSREIYTQTALKPSTEFGNPNYNFAFDFDGDGWTDIFGGPPNGVVYMNPKGESRRWDHYQVVTGVQSEYSMLIDIDGDGRPEMIYSGDGAVKYAKYDPADPTKAWATHAVSERGYGAAHGIGAGDINGDGRMDIVSVYGWWEQPPAGSSQEPWTYHSQGFGRYNRGAFGGQGMFVYDVNGDGLNDVVTALSAHSFGIGWYEQKRDAAGKISFVEHLISGDYGEKSAGGAAFSEPHGTASADVDGDGIPDFIAGKRYWSHLDSYLDPDPYGAPVLYWWRTVRNPKAPGGAEFVPELIHNRSGAGSDVKAVDLNKDGVMDIVTATDRGVFIFWGKPRAAAAKAAAAPAAKK